MLGIRFQSFWSLNSSCKFLELIFRNNFLPSILPKYVVEKNFRQLLQKVLCLWRKQIFVYIDEDFAIN